MADFKKVKYLLVLLIIILFPLKAKAFSEDTTYNVSMCANSSCSTTESKGMYLFDGSYDGNWYYLKDNSMVVRPISAQNLY